MNYKLRFLPQIIVRSPLNPIDSDVTTDMFTEAIYLSSNDLSSELKKTDKSNKKNESNFEKVKLSLHKYKIRASFRCTPFGLMAGVNTAKWNKENEILLDASPQNQFYRKTRLDMNVLCEIVKEAEQKEFIKPYLKYQPNSSLYLIGNNFRYVEYTYINNQRHYHINNVEFTSYLKLILEESQKGLTQLQLAKLLIDDDITEADAINYLDELIASQILVNQLEPALTGIDYYDSIILRLDSIQSEHPNEQLKQFVNTVKKTKEQLQEIDKSIVNTIDKYKHPYNVLKNILPNLKEAKLFQTDLFKKTLQNTIDKTIQIQLLSTINFLTKITPNDTNKILEEFIAKFTSKYHDKAIPLLIAMDEENGIGYPCKKNTGINELVEDIPNYETINSNSNKNSEYEDCLIKILADSKKERVKKVTERDFENIKKSNALLPNSIAVMFSVLNAKTNKIKLINTSGSSAINLLARFASTSTEINGIIKEIADFEETQMPNKILAEIIHLPENRIGNILARPIIRKYEIPYLTKSSLGINNQIQVQNLTIRIKNNTIILFDTKLNREIIPRLSNAHNYSNTSLPVYYFLSDIQNQYFSKSHLGFNWGNLFSQYDFFPRIEFENTILCAAKWILKSKDLEPLKSLSASISDKKNLFIELKKRIQLDDKFLLIDGSEELLIDSENTTSVECFMNIIRTKQTVVLEEYIFDNDFALIRNTDKKPYANECIALLLNEHQYNTTHQQDNFASINKIKHKEPEIENGWIYYKLYCGPKTSDDIIITKFKEITHALLTEKIIDSWFFIRYNDPDSHLRLRLHITQIGKLNEIKQLIDSKLTHLINQYIIHSIKSDKYEREYERYGYNSISLAEKLFFNDSIFVMNVLSLINTIDDNSYRWQIAIRSVDDLLNEFNFNLENKHKFISQLSAAFFKEHGESKELKLTLDLKYRKLKFTIKSIFDWDLNPDFSSIKELLKQKTGSNKPVVSELLLINSNGELQIPINEFIASILHMNLNRLFIGRNRTNELAIYDLLSRHYKSLLIRLNAKKH
ncbi:MAG: lantibiotic dehydratase [Bacteroidota bacterium]